MGPSPKVSAQIVRPQPPATYAESVLDRKSTRLNSSHSQISYAVFCLKQNLRQLAPSFVEEDRSRSAFMPCDRHVIPVLARYREPPALHVRDEQAVDAAQEQPLPLSSF